MTTASFFAGAFEGPRHLPRRLIQPVIDTGEPRVVGSCPARDLSERSQVDAVKASKAVLLGKLAGGAAHGIGGVQGQICRPLLLKLALR